MGGRTTGHNCDGFAHWSIRATNGSRQNGQESVAAADPCGLAHTLAHWKASTQTRVWLRCPPSPIGPAIPIPAFLGNAFQVINPICGYSSDPHSKP